MWRVIRQLQPWLGVVLLSLGAFVVIAALSKGNMKAAAPGLIGLGGLSLIAKATYGGRRWMFILAGLGIGVGLYVATTYSSGAA